MSLKKKLLISIGSLSLVAVITVVAVFAAIQQGLGITSTVTFNALNVDADYSIVVSGQKDGPAAAVEGGFTADEASTTKTAALGDFDFVQVSGTNGVTNVTPIVYAITITNNDEVDSLSVVIDTLTIAGLTISSTGYTPDVATVIAPEGEATFTITINITGDEDNNGHIAGDFAETAVSPSLTLNAVETSV